MNPQHIQWVRRQLAAVSDQPIVRATFRNTPDNLVPTVQRAIDHAMVAPLRVAPREQREPPDQVALDIAGWFTDDPRFAAILRQAGLEWIHHRLDAAGSLDLTGQVDLLFTDLGIEHTDPDTAWICRWIQTAASDPNISLWARANAATACSTWPSGRSMPAWTPARSAMSSLTR
jgi:hypothetical protein